MQCKTHNVGVTFPFTFFSKLKNMENWKFIKQVKETFIARGMSQKIMLISLLYVFTNMIQLCIIKHARTIDIGRRYDYIPTMYLLTE